MYYIPRDVVYKSIIEKKNIIGSCSYSFLLLLLILNLEVIIDIIRRVENGSPR